MYRNPSDSVPESAVSPWMASILMRRGGSAIQRFALTYHQLAAMPRRWRRQLRRRMAVGLGSAALVLALAGPIIVAPALPPAASDATIVVVNSEVANVNNNKCGLIEAIINARTSNAGAMRSDCTAGNINGPDTVSLPANGTFVLTAAHNEQFGPTGLPVITNTVTIDGHGSTIRRSSTASTPQFRILAVDANGALTLHETTISNGYVNTDASYSPYHGGGILALGALTLSNCTITDNEVHGTYAAGGGVFADGVTTITQSQVTQNSASGQQEGYGGGIAIGRDGQATIADSTISANTVGSEYSSSGAGIDVRGQAEVLNSTIAGNFTGGSLFGSYGGGIAVNGNAEATITDSIVSGNTVASFAAYDYTYFPGIGGGISNHGIVQIVNSTISVNVANYGGGLSNMGYGSAMVVQSTVSGNSAHQRSGSFGSGGGLFSHPHLFVENCATTTLKRSIFSGNTADASAPQILWDGSYGCGGEITVDTFNVFGQNGEEGLIGFYYGPTDIVPSVGLSAILSPLANNGGPTQTHALPAGSPALDRAPNAQCTAAPVNGVDQRGEPRNQNGAGGVTNNECDIGSYERAGAPAAQLRFYLSASGSGSVGGVAFAPGDILKFTPAGGWSMHFDASDVGITKNVTAFEIEDNGDILLSLIAAQNVPGVGNVAPQDVLRFTPTSTGANTAGSFAMALDGSANLLTTSGEKIDALGRTPDGRLALSTVGAAAVKRPNNTVLKAQDEDALGFNLGNGQWSEFFNGTAIPGLAAEDVNALWIDPATGDLYISIVGAFNLGGVAGDGRDIVKLTPSGAPGGYTPSLVWDGLANGFPTNIDGLEISP